MNILDHQEKTEKLYHKCTCLRKNKTGDGKNEILAECIHKNLSKNIKLKMMKNDIEDLYQQLCMAEMRLRTICRCTKNCKNRKKTTVQQTNDEKEDITITKLENEVSNRYGKKEFDINVTDQKNTGKTEENFLFKNPENNNVQSAPKIENVPDIIKNTQIKKEKLMNKKDLQVVTPNKSKKTETIVQQKTIQNKPNVNKVTVQPKIGKVLENEPKMNITESKIKKNIHKVNIKTETAAQPKTPRNVQNISRIKTENKIKPITPRAVSASVDRHINLLNYTDLSSFKRSLKTYQSPTRIDNLEKKTLPKRPSMAHVHIPIEDNHGSQSEQDSSSSTGQTEQTDPLEAHIHISCYPKYKLKKCNK